MSLTDKIIEDLWVGIHKGKFMHAGFNTFARAIEAAVREEQDGEIARLKAQQVGLQNINIMNQATMESEIARLRESNAELLEGLDACRKEISGFFLVCAAQKGT